MKKLLAFLMLAAMMLSVCTASAETLPIDGKVVSIQSYPIISQANGMIEQINFSVGDAVQANDCIATIATTKVYAPVAGFTMERRTHLRHPSMTRKRLTSSLIWWKERNWSCR